MKHAGWFQNDTYAAVRPSELHVCRTHQLAWAHSPSRRHAQVASSRVGSCLPAPSQNMDLQHPSWHKKILFHGALSSRCGLCADHARWGCAGSLSSCAWLEAAQHHGARGGREQPFPAPVLQRGRQQHALAGHQPQGGRHSRAGGLVRPRLLGATSQQDASHAGPSRCCRLLPSINVTLVLGVCTTMRPTCWYALAVHHPRGAVSAQQDACHHGHAQESFASRLCCSIDGAPALVWSHQATTESRFWRIARVCTGRELLFDQCCSPRYVRHLG